MRQKPQRWAAPASGPHQARTACDDLIITTGEGLRRLLACVDNHDPALKRPFLDALAQVRKITRGPKPARALRELGLQPDLAAEVPTTEGIIASLGRQDLTGRRIGVQRLWDKLKETVDERLPKFE